MYHVYILYSALLGEYYCGQTNDISKRLSRHNIGETQSIKHGIPWILVGYLSCKTRTEAMKIEKAIKKRGIKRWLDQNQFKLTLAR